MFRDLNSIEEETVKYYPERDLTLEKETHLSFNSDEAITKSAKKKQNIHFNENLPMNDSIIERQANLTIANLKTKNYLHKIPTLQKTKESFTNITQNNKSNEELILSVKALELKKLPLKPGLKLFFELK